MRVDRIELRYIHPLGGIEVYGLGLYNFDTGETAGVTQSMRSKLGAAYQDDEIRVSQNSAAFPRAYVVPNARVAPDGSNALSAMLDTPFDPRREVMLEPGGVESHPLRRSPAQPTFLCQQNRCVLRLTALPTALQHQRAAATSSM